MEKNVKVIVLGKVKSGKSSIAAIIAHCLGSGITNTLSVSDEDTGLPIQLPRAYVNAGFVDVETAMC